MRVLLCCSAACAAARLPALPKDGGPAWSEVRSAHFTVWSDGDPDRVREVIQHMEYLRSVVYGVAFPFMKPGGSTFVVALRDSREARMFLPPNVAGYTQVGSSIDQPLFVVALDGQRDDRVIAHELTHAIAYNALHRQAQWFAEGFATYFETIAFYDEQRSLNVGEIPHYVRETLAVRRLLPVATLFSCTHCADDFLFYASSWALIAYLRNTHGTELETYLRALADATPEAAWQQAFPTLSPEQLDHDVPVWLGTGGLKVWHFDIEPKVWEMTQRALSDADVYAVRALLGEVFDKPQDQILGNVSAALALDPTNVMAADVGCDVRRTKMPLETARKLADAHPDSWIAWARVSTALEDDQQMVDAGHAEAKMCAIVLKNPALGRYKPCLDKYGH